ncbi:hypothetical protein [Streptomyces sp. YU58]|uniref:hypothetical protein n=1 Tax=Streptomyces sp. SX92 TaxID=3158972 RepID=UPI0027BA4A79|nr:hypothetical protein [Streptomyces coralus]WLW52283.1 hypothetical protein QU709_13215 [Streptomyces coralus]
MADEGGRRRLWRRIVVAWVVLVAVAGGVTLWLQDSVEPPGPYRWEEARPSEPSLPTGRDTPCPSPTAGAQEGAAFVCDYSVIR